MTLEQVGLLRDVLTQIKCGLSQKGLGKQVEISLENSDSNIREIEIVITLKGVHGRL